MDSNAYNHDKTHSVKDYPFAEGIAIDGVSRLLVRIAQCTICKKTFSYFEKNVKFLIPYKAS